MHFGCASGISGLYLHFLDEVLFQNMAQIDDLFLLRDAQVALGILSSSVVRQHFYLTWTIPPFPSFLYVLVGFGKF
jgi:hypothetical protein